MIKAILAELGVQKLKMLAKLQKWFLKKHLICAFWKKENLKYFYQKYLQLNEKLDVLRTKPLEVEELHYKSTFIETIPNRAIFRIVQEKKEKIVFRMSMFVIRQKQRAQNAQRRILAISCAIGFCVIAESRNKYQVSRERREIKHNQTHSLSNFIVFLLLSLSPSLCY